MMPYDTSTLRHNDTYPFQIQQKHLSYEHSLPPSLFFCSLRYMAFHVLQADIAAARSIAERALRTIDFREEEEKMNLWIAYVNLEHKYGTMDSLNKVFQRAVTESRGKYIHLNLAEQYEKAKDFAGAATIFEKALKKHKKSKKVWMCYQKSTTSSSLLPPVINLNPSISASLSLSRCGCAIRCLVCGQGTMWGHGRY